MEARIWSKLVLEFLMEKVKYDGFFRNANDSTELIVLPNIPRAQQPEIVCKYFQMFSLVFFLGNP